MWILFACGSAIFAGFTAILAKIGITNTDSNVATAIRTIVVVIFAWMMVFVVGSQDTISSISGRTLVFLGLSGLATGASWLCYFRALQLGEVNKVTPVDKSSTVLTMVLAWIFLGESVTMMSIGALVLIGMGTYLMIEKKDQHTIENNNSKDHSWFFYAIFAALFAALTAILGKVGIEGVESTLGTAIRTIVVLVMAWVMVFVTNKQYTVRTIECKSWIFLILSGFATGGSWLCYYRALQTGPASVVVPIDKLSILVTILFSCIFLNEKLSLRSLAGLIMIVGGTLLLLL